MCQILEPPSQKFILYLVFLGIDEFWDSHLPIAASFVRSPCFLEHCSIASLISDTLGRFCVLWNILHAFVVSIVHGRIVSVRPCLKADVLQDS
jgi:hypothetical protein